MGFLDKAKAAAEQATARVKDGVDDVQAKRGLAQTYEKLGAATYALLESGEISHPSLVPYLEEVRALKARVDDTPPEDATAPPPADDAAPPSPAMPI